MWWSFRKKQPKFSIEPKIQDIVNYGANYVVKHLEHSGLISLYIGGSVLTDDRTPFSDIDLFGIVTEDFDMDQEKIINDEFKVQKNTLCDGMVVKFRAIPIGSLNGGEQKGIVKYFSPALFIKKLPFFNFFWGQEFNPARDFDIIPLSLKEELEYLSKQVKYSIIDLRAEREKFHFWDFPKKVMELVIADAEYENRYKYSPSYKKIDNFFKRKPEHIVHRAYSLRMNPDTTRHEVVEFCNEAEAYLEDLQARI